MFRSKGAGIELVDSGSGSPAYFVIDPGQEPWLALNIHELLEHMTSASVIYLASPNGEVANVCLSSDHDGVDWSVTLADTGQLVERVVYTDTNPGDEWEFSLHVTHVNGFAED